MIETELIEYSMEVPFDLISNMRIIEYYLLSELI